MSRTQETLVALLSAGGVIQIIQLAYKLVQYFIERSKQKAGEDTSLIIRDKNELASVREWLAAELEKASLAYEKVKEERHQLEMKLVIAERDLQDERRFSSDQSEEIAELRSECEQLTNENKHLRKIDTAEARED
jgi:hypothetical protein